MNSAALDLRARIDLQVAREDHLPSFVQYGFVRPLPRRQELLVAAS